MKKIKDEDTIVGGSLRKIGNALSLRPEIDNELRVTGLIRSNLSVVDIIPVDYALNFKFLADKKNTQFAISYDYTVPTENYKKRCEKYKLKPYDGLQLWLTDDTQAYEEITHTFANNLIEAGIDKILNSTIGKGLRQMGELGKSFNVIGTVNDRTNTWQQKKLKEMGEKGGLASNAANLTGTFADIVIRGKQLSLPKIWRQSDYNPSVTFNVKLVSPYGSPEAIKAFIIAPLTYILLMASPESGDGLTYGLYQPVKIKSYGITNINLGAITSVGLRRGGRETSYNAFKQPLQLDVSIQVMPLTSGFAYMGEGIQDVATMDDAAEPYAENATGSPAITTVGNIIQSLRPAPNNVVNSASSNATTASVVAGADNSFTKTNSDPSVLSSAWGKFSQSFK